MMLKTLLCVVLTLVLCAPTYAQHDIIADSNRPIEERINNAIQQMTLEEKVRMCFGGEKFGEVILPGVPRLGILPMYGSDGPRGVRTGAVTVFPSGLGFAATWNPQLIKQASEVIGEESRANNVSIIFGPAFNINRDPLGGRFFEYFSEDPYLSGKIAAAQIMGLQSQGVSSCIKHFAANGRDLNRNNYMSNIDERTLREIYLRGFEIAVKDAEPWACMTAANGLNGLLCSDSKWLLNDVLRGDWGFKGLVLTDFCHSRSTVKAALAGLDIDMPWDDFAKAKFGKPLMDAVTSGQLPLSTVDNMVRNILWVRWKTGLLDHKDIREGATLNTKEHQNVALQTARESVVLLKNDNNLLPLDINKTRKVVLIGPNCSQRFCILGLGGSSGAEALYEITPLKGLQAKLKDKLTYLPLTGDSEFKVISDEFWSSLNGQQGVDATYVKQGDAAVNVKRRENNVDFRWFNTSPVPQTIDAGHANVTIDGIIKAPSTGNYTLKLTTDNHAEMWVGDMGAQAIRNTQSGVPQSNTAMFFFEEGRTYHVRITYSQSVAGMENSTQMNYWAKSNPSLRLEWALPSDAQTITRSIQPYAEQLSSADAIIFVGGTDHNLDCEGRDRTSMRYPSGQTELIRQVAAINPKLVVALMHGAPIDLPWIDSVPAVVDLFFPGMECGTALAEVVFGDVNPSGRLTFSWPEALEDSPVYKYATQDNDNVNYEEKLMVGYRYFDTKNIKPRYEFGYGLSYTSFEYSNMKVRKQGEDYIVSLQLKNTGKRDGAEVVQIYVGQKGCKYERPRHELKAFEKVALKAGEQKTVTFKLGYDAFAYWNPDTKAWHADNDEFVVEAAHSSRDIRQSVKVNRK